MAGCDLKNLNPARFSELLANREKAIASAKETPKDCEPSVNKLANALHPGVQHLIVADIVEQSADTKSYICKPDKELGTDSLAYFCAGQYLSVSVYIDGVKYSRPYSISSSPKEALGGEYRLTVKRVDGGKVSNFILDKFAVGTKFDVSDPAGNFTYEPLRDAKHVIALAGGSGITPFISLAKSIADNDEDLELTILYGNRTVSDILFKDELDTIAEACNRVRIVYILSEQKVEGYEHGFITSELVHKYAPSDIYSIFVCGNQAMTSYLSDELKKLGLKRKYIRFELRGEVASVDCGTDKEITITVRAQNGTAKTVGKSSESILRILENAGITPPTSCRSGECGFCRSRLITGEVYISQETDTRRMADKKYGYIHPCCTYAKGDIEIEVSAKLPTED